MPPSPLISACRFAQRLTPNHAISPHRISTGGGHERCQRGLRTEELGNDPTQAISPFAQLEPSTPTQFIRSKSSEPLPLENDDFHIHPGRQELFRTFFQSPSPRPSRTSTGLSFASSTRSRSFESTTDVLYSQQTTLAEREASDAMLSEV